MRDDFSGEMPDIRATDDDRVGAEVTGQKIPEPPVVRAIREPAPVSKGNGLLWAVCCSLLIAFVGLGYWSYEQQSRLQQQLVATQESFARISEEAAGRLQDISGKVTATESSLTQGEQERIQQIRQLEEKVKQLEAALQDQQEREQAQQQKLDVANRELGAQAAQVAAVQQQLEEQNEAAEQQREVLADLSKRMETHGQAQTDLSDKLAEALENVQNMESQLARQQGELQALTQALKEPRMEQDMLVLRSEVDQRLEAVDESLEAINSFRVQTNRTLSTLRDQLANLQQQIQAR